MAPPKTPSGKKAKAKAEDPPNGQIRDGVWHCNCTPRLPAVQFTVRRETENKGRSFYSCQKKGNKGNKCDFFLWSEDARKREVGAVFGNSGNGGGGPSGKTTKSAMKQTTIHMAISPRAERRHYTEKTPISRTQDINFGEGGNSSSSSKGKGKGTSTAATTSTTPSAGSATLRASSSRGSNNAPPLPEAIDLDSDISTDAEDELIRIADTTTTPGRSSTAEATATGSKRKRPSNEQEEEEEEEADEYGDFSSGEEEQLAAIADRSEKKQNAFATPAVGAARTRDVDMADGMPTPLTGKPVRRVLFSAPAAATTADSPSTTEAAAATITTITTTTTSGGEPSSSSSSNTSIKRQRVNEDGGFTSSPGTAAAAAAAAEEEEWTSGPTTPSSTTTTHMTQEVMSLLLRTQKFEGRNPPALRDVRAALERHAAKARGLERGRDASRLAAKKAEARIAELEGRVAELEGRLETDAEARRKLRSGIMELYGKS